MSKSIQAALNVVQEYSRQHKIFALIAVERHLFTVTNVSAG